ncbi:MAG: response regulator transcription factor [Lachnospiraceae bacterium]|nr:response regulator transcription factor [Lachnospiraceae bacterium]
MRILYAEDEPDLNHIVTRRLTEEGYSVDSCLNGEDALYYLENTEYDAAILDIMMPGKSGMEILQTIRAAGNHVPVLFLTARDAVSDRVKGLDAGADDYLIKPFSVSELLARVRVMVRRDSDHAGSVLTADDLVMDLVAHRVRRGEKDIPLSGKEFALLEYLMHNQGIALSRDRIENHIWNYDYEGGTNVVDVYISHLRRKIDDGFDKKLIRTVRGVGYTLSAD